MLFAIFLAAVITFALRYVPLKLVSRLSPTGTVAKVTEHLPLGLMLILVVYTFLETDSTQQMLRLALGTIVALGLEIRFSNTLLSFVTGLIVYAMTASMFS